MAENFGNFLKELFRDLGTSPEEAADSPLIRVSARQIYNWMEMQAPPSKGDAEVQLSDYLCVPLRLFREAARGERSLPDTYRERSHWQARQRGAMSIDETAVSSAQPDARQVTASVRWLSGQSPQTYRDILGALTPDELKRLHARVNEHWDEKHRRGTDGRGRKTA